MEPRHAVRSPYPQNGHAKVMWTIIPVEPSFEVIPAQVQTCERSLQMIAACSSSSLLSWAPDTVEQQEAFPLSAVQTLPTELGSIIKGLLFYTIKLRVVCYTTWRTRIASF